MVRMVTVPGLGLPGIGNEPGCLAVADDLPGLGEELLLNLLVNLGGGRLSWRLGWCTTAFGNALLAEWGTANRDALLDLVEEYDAVTCPKTLTLTLALALSVTRPRRGVRRGDLT